MRAFLCGSSAINEIFFHRTAEWAAQIKQMLEREHSSSFYPPSPHHHHHPSRSTPYSLSTLLLTCCFFSSECSMLWLRQSSLCLWGVPWKSWDLGMTGAERLHAGVTSPFWMHLNPACCFWSGPGRNLLKHIRLRVATVSLFVPAAAATEC